MNRLTIKNSDGSYSQPTHTTFEKMFYKLAEFEDFMEQYKIQNLNQLHLITIFYETFSKKNQNMITDEYLKIAKFIKMQGFDRFEEFKDSYEDYKSRAFQNEDDNNIVNQLIEKLELPLDENLIIDKVSQIQKENKELKNIWQKLNDWLEDYLAQNRKIDEEARHGTDSSIIANIRIDTLKTILYTMLKLEKQKTE